MLEQRVVEMKVSDVSYLLGRAHGIIGKVLTKSQISFLLSSDNLKELRAAFTQTIYDDVIGDFNFETQISEIARALKNSFADLLISFHKQSSSAVRKKIELFSDRYNAENLRIILQGKHTGMSKEAIMARLIPVAGYSLDYYSKLIDSTIPKIISAQKNVELHKDLKRAYEEFLSSNRFTPLESAIDQYIYKSLPKVSHHYKTYVNMKNILSVCRCIVLDVPAYRYILPNKFISKSLSASSVKEVLGIYNFPPYSSVFSKYLGEKEVPLHELEFAVERFLLKKWRRLFRFGTVFSTDSLIGFFELVKRLRFSISGKPLFRNLLITSWYMIVVAGAYCGAFLLRFDGLLPPKMNTVVFVTLPILLAVRILFFISFGLYSRLLSYVSVDDVWDTMKAIGFSTLIFMVIIWALYPGYQGFPRSVFIIETMLPCFPIILGTLFVLTFITLPPLSFFKPGPFIVTSINF